MINSRTALTAALCALALSTAAAADGYDPYPSQPTYDESQAPVAAGDATRSGQGGHYDWESVRAEQPVTSRLPEERTSLAWSLALLAAAALTGLLTLAGLTLTYRSLRADMRRNRKPQYHPRGPETARGKP